MQNRMVLLKALILLNFGIKLELTKFYSQVIISNFLPLGLHQETICLKKYKGHLERSGNSEISQS